MSLGFGNAPFGRHRGAWSFPVPEHVWYVEDWPRRMRAVLGTETVLDTREAKLLHASGSLPVHWFPLDHIRTELLSPATAKPGEADGEWFDVTVGDRVAPAAVRVIDRPLRGGPPLAGYATLEFGAMDRWFEEDDPIYAHPRDPYHRVDVRASSLPITVLRGEAVVAKSLRPKLLFETANPIRYYLPFDDVRLDLLVRSDTISECPYKGDGQHWHLVLGADVVEDAAWSLPHPLPEGFPAAEHVCFYPSKVDVLVEGRVISE